jgi:hypothetical protein
MSDVSKNAAPDHSADGMMVVDSCQTRRAGLRGRSRSQRLRSSSTTAASLCDQSITIIILIIITAEKGYYYHHRSPGRGERGWGSDERGITIGAMPAVSDRVTAFRGRVAFAASPARLSMIISVFKGASRGSVSLFLRSSEGGAEGRRHQGEWRMQHGWPFGGLSCSPSG